MGQNLINKLKLGFKIVSCGFPVRKTGKSLHPFVATLGCKRDLQADSELSAPSRWCKKSHSKYARKGAKAQSLAAAPTIFDILLKPFPLRVLRAFVVKKSHCKYARKGAKAQSLVAASPFSWGHSPPPPHLLNFRAANPQSEYLFPIQKQCFAITNTA